MADKKCKKLGNRATKGDRADAHRIKMEMKTALREHRSKEALDKRTYVLANISREHPCYGDTPAENEARKFEGTENNS